MGVTRISLMVRSRRDLARRFNGVSWASAACGTAPAARPVALVPISCRQSRRERGIEKLLANQKMFSSWQLSYEPEMEIAKVGCGTVHARSGRATIRKLVVG